jgi:phage gpG-like protein
VTYTLEVESLDRLEEQLAEFVESLRVPVQDAMARTLQDITQANFGPGEGEDRPERWQPLSQGYAKAAHGGDTTPTEILTQDLKDSIQVESDDPDHARVFSDIDYAPIQQWGGGEWNTPARPFFPIIGDQDTGVLTPYTEEQIRLAAEQAIEDHLNRL